MVDIEANLLRGHETSQFPLSTWAAQGSFLPRCPLLSYTHPHYHRTEALPPQTFCSFPNSACLMLQQAEVLLPSPDYFLSRQSIFLAPPPPSPLFSTLFCICGYGLITAKDSCSCPRSHFYPQREEPPGTAAISCFSLVLSVLGVVDLSNLLMQATRASVAISGEMDQNPADTSPESCWFSTPFPLAFHSLHCPSYPWGLPAGASVSSLQIALFSLLPQSKTQDAEYQRGKKERDVCCHGGRRGF